jgi:hypothetical protein
MEQLVASVKETMLALNNPGQTQAANAMLMQFEQSNEAWQVLDLLLREPPGSAHRFLASITLYSKVQRDLTTQLGPAVYGQFSQNLVAHLIRLSQEPHVDMNVCRYVCLSIAATAVQMNQDGIIKQIFEWLNPLLGTTPQVILELLILLPEECRNRNVCVSSETRNLFGNQLKRSFPEVLNFLKYVSAIADPSSDMKMGNQVCHCAIACDCVIFLSFVWVLQILKCLERWIDNTDIDGPALSSHPMMIYALDALSVQRLFEQAVDTCISIWKKFRCSDPAIVRSLFPRVVALRALWTETVKPFATEDINDLDDQLNICRAICRLATETAESCLPIVCGEDDYGQMTLVALLIDCAGFRHDFGIARIPLNLFYSICRNIRFCKNPPSPSYAGDGYPDPGEDPDFYGAKDRLSMR